MTCTDSRQLKISRQVLAATALVGTALWCLGTAPVWAQTGYTSAADRARAQIVNQSIGTAYTSAAVNRSALQTAFAPVPKTATVGSVGPRSRAPSFGVGVNSSFSKPFAKVSSSPTLSPYLGLFNETLSNSVLPNYNTFVRPQLQQQRFNSQVSRQASLINQRFQEMTAQPAYQPQGSEYQAPTGHAVAFGYYSHYYPGNARRRR